MPYPILPVYKESTLISADLSYFETALATPKAENGEQVRINKSIGRRTG